MPFLQGCRCPAVLGWRNSKGSLVTPYGAPLGVFRSLNTETQARQVAETQPGSAGIFLPPWEVATLGPHGSGFLHQVSQDPKGRVIVNNSCPVSVLLIYQVGYNQDVQDLTVTLLLFFRTRSSGSELFPWPPRLISCAERGTDCP